MLRKLDGSGFDFRHHKSFGVHQIAMMLVAWSRSDPAE
jgi:hypothetical protein